MKNRYIIDAKNEVEVARLILMEEVFNREMDPLPEHFCMPEANAHILDLASGTGRWAANISRMHPTVNVEGIDIDPLMNSWANAQLIDHSRVVFQLGDILQPLPFPDGTFDLVNARFLMSLMENDLWLPLFRECFRVTKTGGFMRATETATMSVPNLLHHRLEFLIHKAYFKARKAFSEFDYGVAPMLGLLLQQAGYTLVEEKPYLLNFSYGTKMHDPLAQNFVILLELLKPFLHIYLVPEETQHLDVLVKEVSGHLYEQNFRAHWLITGVTVQK